MPSQPQLDPVNELTGRVFVVADPDTNALLVTLLVPPTAIVLGVLFLGEVIAPHDFAGLALIGLGLAAIDGRALSAVGRFRLRLRPAV